jgi:hypothetical protein
VTPVVARVRDSPTFNASIGQITLLPSFFGGLDGIDFPKKGDILRRAGFFRIPLFFFGIWRLASWLRLRRAAKPPNWAQSLA